MRRFYVNRKVDETGNSGTGHVAEGVQFTDGRVAWHWSGATNALGVTSTIVYDSIEDAITVHGHSGLTVVEWIDE